MSKVVLVITDSLGVGALPDAAQYGDAGLMKALLPSSAVLRSRVTFWLSIVALALLVVALARPRYGTKKETGAVVEFLLLNQLEKDLWETLAGPGKRAKEDGKFLYCLDKGATKCVTGIFESASVSISATLMTFPLIGHFFGEIPVLFVLSNIIILPYMMFIFILLLIITLFCQITTLWGGVTIMQFLLLPLRSWAGFVGSLSWANIDISVGVFFIIGWLVSAVLSSKYIFMNRKGKIATTVLWLALFITIVVLCLV